MRQDVGAVRAWRVCEMMVNDLFFSTVIDPLCALARRRSVRDLPTRYGLAASRLRSDVRPAGFPTKPRRCCFLTLSKHGALCSTQVGVPGVRVDAGQGGGCKARGSHRERKRARERTHTQRESEIKLEVHTRWPLCSTQVGVPGVRVDAGQGGGCGAGGSQLLVSADGAHLGHHPLPYPWRHRLSGSPWVPGSERRR